MYINIFFPGRGSDIHELVGYFILFLKKGRGGGREKEKKCLPLERHLAEICCEATWHNIKGPGCEEIKPDS